MNDSISPSEVEAILQKIIVDKDIVKNGYLWEARGHEEEFPFTLHKILGDVGIMGMTFPEQYGGIGASMEAVMHASEILSFAWPSWQLGWSVNTTLTGYPIMTFGTREQKTTFLPRLASGEVFGCYMLTEPNMGSDAAALQATAEYKDGKWVLNGSKMFITNAQYATIGIVFARVKTKTSQKKHSGITAFIIESEVPGFKDIKGVCVHNMEKRGFHCAPFAEVNFDNVALAENSLLGELGDGFYIAMETLDMGRMGIASQAAGMLRRVIYEAEEYTKQRTAFGKRLIDFDVISSDTVKAQIAQDVGWRYIQYVARLKDGGLAGNAFSILASRAKFNMTTKLKRHAHILQEHFGGTGYTTEHRIGDIINDADAPVLYEGASHIQILKLARELRKE